MIIRIKKKTLEQGILSVSGLLIIVSLLIGVSFTTNYVTGATNYTNATVIAKLNVTNTGPNITSVVLDDLADDQPDEIDLTTNTVTAVYCNATVWDYNGWQDIDPDSVNATIYINNTGDVTIDSADDNNNHYTNRSCGSCVPGPTSTEAICDCRFAVQYYANATVWKCNISITDKGGTGKPGEELNFSDSGTSTATITKLLALDTPTTVLDYGNLSVTEISAAIERNVTNVGNVDFNLTTRGYGSDNESVGQNVSMICDFGNITFGNQRYVVGNNVTFGAMKNLTNQTLDSNFTFSQKTDDNNLGLEFNETFWRLEIPLSVGGICNGTIIFGAVEAT